MPHTNTHTLTHTHTDKQLCQVPPLFFSLRVRRRVGTAKTELCCTCVCICVCAWREKVTERGFVFFVSRLGITQFLYQTQQPCLVKELDCFLFRPIPVRCCAVMRCAVVNTHTTNTHMQTGGAQGGQQSCGHVMQLCSALPRC